MYQYKNWESRFQLDTYTYLYLVWEEFGNECDIHQIAGFKKPFPPQIQEQTTITLEPEFTNGFQ